MANTKGTITIAVRLRRLIPFAVAHAVMDWFDRASSAVKVKKGLQ